LLVELCFFVIEVDLKSQVYATYLFVYGFIVNTELELDLLGHSNTGQSEISAEDQFLFRITRNRLFHGDGLKIEQTLVFKLFVILLELIIGFSNTIFIFLDFLDFNHKIAAINSELVH
jgi:hypothetical protein